MEKKVTFSPLVALIAVADRAESTAFEACRKAAQGIFERAKKGAAIKDEHARLMSEAFDLAAKEGLVIANRNTRQHIGQHLLICFEPSIDVEVSKTEKATVTKPAAQCKTAREVAAAAKTIREVSGMSDGRKGNAPRQTTKQVSKEPTFLALLDAYLKDAESRERVFKAIRAAGYDVTPAKVSAPVKTEKPAKKVQRVKKDVAVQQAAL